MTNVTECLVTNVTALLRRQRAPQKIKDKKHSARTFIPPVEVIFSYNNHSYIQDPEVAVLLLPALVPLPSAAPRFLELPALGGRRTVFGLPMKAVNPPTPPTPVCACAWVRTEA